MTTELPHITEQIRQEAKILIKFTSQGQQRDLTMVIQPKFHKEKTETMEGN